MSRIARQTSRVAARGVQLAIVVGGGNILRGAQLSRGSDVIKEATAHYMGMTATVINGLALQDALEHEGCATRLLTTIRMDEVAEPFIRRRALSHLDKGRVVILATGTGSPFVTTDTAAALRGKELGVERCSRRPASTASIRPTPRKTRTPSSTSTSLSSRSCATSSR